MHRPKPAFFSASSPPLNWTKLSFPMLIWCPFAKTRDILYPPTTNCVIKQCHAWTPCLSSDLTRRNVRRLTFVASSWWSLTLFALVTHLWHNNIYSSRRQTISISNFQPSGGPKRRVLYSIYICVLYNARATHPSWASRIIYVHPLFTPFVSHNIVYRVSVLADFLGITNNQTDTSHLPKNCKPICVYPTLSNFIRIGFYFFWFWAWLSLESAPKMFGEVPFYLIPQTRCCCLK